MSDYAFFADRLRKRLVCYLRRYAHRPVKLGVHFLWSLLCLSRNADFYRSVKDDRIHLLFSIGGGLGDILIALNYIYHLIKQTDGDFIVEIAIRPQEIEAVRRFLQGHIWVTRIIPRGHGKQLTDCCVNIVRVPEIFYANEKKLARLAPKFAAWVDIIKKFQHRFYEILSNDYLLERYTLMCGRTRLGEPNFGDYVTLTDSFRINLPVNLDEILEKFGLNKGKFITVQVGVGGKQFNNSRVLAVEKYRQIVAALRSHYPEYRIVQLGYPGRSQIDGVDLDLVGKTTIDECLAILARSALHIDGECGLIHMRHFISRQPSVVIFGPTLRDFYSYPENINISAEVCTTCEWMHHKWENVCLRTGAEPLCLQKIDADFIIKQIIERKVLAT